MNAVFSEALAKKLCIEWMTELDNSKLGLSLCEHNKGRMLGILVTEDNTVYKAFSGLMIESLDIPGCVPPVFDTKTVNRILEDGDRLIKTVDKDRSYLVSQNCWESIKKEYKFHCWDGEIRSLYDIHHDCTAGTGDCCAPKLLNACFKDGKKPASMAEFFYGNGSYLHKTFYTPCNLRCKPIMKHILGLDVIFVDDDIVVVNKPSGMLAIEGKGEDKQDCIASRVRNLYNTINQPCIHRLDQATSGLMVLGRTKHAHDTLSADFENHRVYKEYEALVEGKIIDIDGKIELPIRLDTDNRPHQIVDFKEGKTAITEWQNIGIIKYEGRYVTKLRLIPKTGRTHQLRVHCAEGLKHPIVNDSLYGENPNKKELQLCAKILSFEHPTTKKRMVFTL